MIGKVVYCVTVVSFTRQWAAPCYQVTLFISWRPKVNQCKLSRSCSRHRVVFKLQHWFCYFSRCIQLGVSEVAALRRRKSLVNKANDVTAGAQPEIQLLFRCAVTVN